MKRVSWIAWWIACLIGIPSVAACADEDPSVRQGSPSAAPDNLTTYCLPDGSGMRVYERQFPMGGRTPLFSVVYTGGLRPYAKAYCQDRSF